MDVEEMETDVLQTPDLGVDDSKSETAATDETIAVDNVAAEADETIAVENVEAEAIAVENVEAEAIAVENVEAEAATQAAESPPTEQSPDEPMEQGGKEDSATAVPDNIDGATDVKTLMDDIEAAVNSLVNGSEAETDVATAETVDHIETTLNDVASSSSTDLAAVATQPDSGIADESEEASTEVSGESQENVLQAAINAAENSTDLLEPSSSVLPAINPTEDAEKGDEVGKLKPKVPTGSFSLGVPGLTFSAQNLKVASDGTKMVQIHQSQITPTQLKALQSNPNIKVVFRHIPSGKSFTTPPKNLFQQKAAKRKISEDGTIDDSIYNFEDDYDDDLYQPPQPRTKFSRMSNGNAKFARYNPNVGMKKRGPGRPRSTPDGMGMTHIHARKPNLPAQIMLTDALAKLNNPNAQHTIKVHTSQVTHDILINMELHPSYNIVLTSKHEVPESEDTLQDLVKEWEDKEEKGEEKQEETPVAPAEEVDAKEERPDPIVEEELDEEERERLLEEEEREADERLASEQLRLREMRKEKEEADILAAALTEKPSRSGRIRKPSRYSLDIARLTKRSKAGYTSGDDDPPVTPPPAKASPPQIRSPPRVSFTPDPSKPVKRGRGRPKKIKPGEATSDEGKNEQKPTEIELSPKKSEPMSSPKKVDSAPRVVMSPSDKKMADSVLESGEEGEEKSEKKDEEVKKDDGVEDTQEHKEEIKSEDKENTQPVEEKEQTEESEKEEKTEAMEVDDGNKEEETAQPETKKEENKEDNSKEEDISEKPEEQKTDEADKEKMDTTQETEGKNESSETDESKIVVAEKTNNEGENPSDVLARKLSKESTDQTETTKSAESELKDFVEEEGDVDNKYRLRKLLQQCSIDEIRSVAIPRAIQSLSLGDFFLYKSGQMSKEKVSYNALYKQLELLYTSVEKESIRYSTLLRRANKVGGDRRMDKVILMPVYNKQAAESLHINSSSIDAHIGGIYQRPTPQMIAANSFRMDCKMEPPVHRLKLPDLTDKAFQARKKNRINPQKINHGETDKDLRLNQGNWKRGYQIRKPNYLLGQPQGVQSTLQEQARIQLANRHQSQLNASVDAATTNTTPSMAQPTDTSASSVLTTTMEPTTALSNDQEGTTLVMDDGSGGLVSAEEGKQLVSIGDGQYVELPEGYTLIQTDDGYIIGQPGATFVQGEDGNVYMTSTEENTEGSDQVLTTTAQMSEQPTENVLEQLSQT